MSLLVVGSTAFDTVETPSGTARDCLGGSSVYCALAARMFTKVRLVSVVGQDFPAEHRRLLQLHGIDLTGLEEKPGRTFRWHGRYSADMNSRTTIDVQLNTFGDFRPVVPAAFQDTRFVFLANGAPATQMSVLQQMRAPEFVVADTMDLWIEREREGLQALLRKVHGVILNDAEVRQLTGEANLIRAGRKVLDLGPTLAIVKKGEHGCFVFSRSLHYALPAYPTAQVVDPTGAGDSFAGGFMGYLAGVGATDVGALKRAVAYGTVTASLTVEGFGVERLAAADRATVDKRFQDLLQFVTP